MSGVQTHWGAPLPNLAALPDDFVWGAATAAYQIEGAVAADGRGPSIWDTFSHTPGAVRDGDTGDVAADHYHRWLDDVAAMAEMGLGAYRLSTAWPRIVPTGSGEVNDPGLAFYDRLVDALLAAGIAPYVTLYHWDLPQPLQDAGGWANRETAYRFAEYATAIGERLGDRVATWTTLNEPWCSAFLGHGDGHHAPGHQDRREAMHAAHHLNLAHGLAAQALRATGVRGDISLTANVHQFRADSPTDADAADLLDLVANRIFLDPVIRGHYPAGLAEATSDITDWSVIRDGDEAIIGTGIDVLGVNYYHPSPVRWAPERRRRLPSQWVGGEHVEQVEMPGLHTAMGWPVDHTGLADLLIRLHRDYPGTPLVITENGAAFDDVVDADDQVHDPLRVGYLHDHIQTAADAVADGVDLRGYFVWSFMDNFEWAFGYSRRFGLLHVDYATQQRRWKDSARWYQQLLQQWAEPPR